MTLGKHILGLVLRRIRVTLISVHTHIDGVAIVSRNLSGLRKLLFVINDAVACRVLCLVVQLLVYVLGASFDLAT